VSITVPDCIVVTWMSCPAHVPAEGDITTPVVRVDDPSPASATTAAVGTAMTPLSVSRAM
jgi:hypothetical protein